MNRASRIHKVCDYLRMGTHGQPDNGPCEKCPAFEVDARYGKVQRGCYGIALEVCNIAKYGNAWGHPVANWFLRKWFRIKRCFATQGPDKQ
jgi:hypothetical protein